MQGGMDMKLGEVLPIYRAYRQQLVDQRRDLTKQRDEAQKKYEITGEQCFADEAATLRLSVDASNDAFHKNQEVLDSLTEQYAAAWNAEVARQQADPETGMAATISKIMTTVARMCAGDKVPYADEQKVMEYNSKLYMKAKQAQMAMAAMKEKQKEYDSLWDEEGGEYDPEAAAENAEAAGELPEIPEGGAQEVIEQAEVSEA